ncbi:hypothetical protein KSP40_PGU019993 [Platanthera guangdongensis]|uniref:Uncharacterized protein n=1 Tax=Platanthera guangdongensis TaxID=2320717 RepID=A0ABR2N5E5_9ASPA
MAESGVVTCNTNNATLTEPPKRRRSCEGEPRPDASRAGSSWTSSMPLRPQSRGGRRLRRHSP